MLPERRDPTHVLTITIPLALEPPAPDFDAVADAVRLALAVSRAAYTGHVCDEVTVAIADS